MLLQALADSGGDADALRMIDITIVREHHCVAAQKGDYRQGLGRSRGGFSTEIHLLINAHNLQISSTLTPGEAHDSTAYAELMDERDSNRGILLADRGYDTDAIRQDSATVVPSRRYPPN